MSKDYYHILGVSKNASKDEIKQAFRKLAHEHHPDKKGGNEAKFKEANEAYSVLSDDTKRAQYDRFGSAGPTSGGNAGGGNPFGQGFGGFDFSGFQQGGQGFEFDIGDIFGDFFGGRQERAKRGRDISVDIEISFKESVFGVERAINLNKNSTCEACHGSGAKAGTEMKTCGTCGGKGKVQEAVRSLMGTFATTRTCPECAGKGKIPKEKCPECTGAGVRRKQDQITVSIPAGIESGETLRVTSRGEAIASGQAGDLYIKIHVHPHPLFRKEGVNLVCDIKVKLSDALLGADYPLETLDGNIVLKIPEGVTHGEILRVKGKGVQNERGKRGDLLVRVLIELPRKLSKAAKKAVEELKKEGM